MLILWIGNVGNFTITHKDGIVVLTHTRGLLYPYSCVKVSYDLQFRTWHCSSTFRVLIRDLLGTEKVF